MEATTVELYNRGFVDYAGGGVVPPTQDSLGMNDLHHAVTLRSLPEVRNLLTASPELVRQLIYGQDNLGKTPLHYAATLKERRIWEILIDQPMSQIVLCLPDNTGRSPVHMLIEFEYWGDFIELVMRYSEWITFKASVEVEVDVKGKTESIMEILRKRWPRVQEIIWEEICQRPGRYEEMYGVFGKIGFSVERRWIEPFSHYITKNGDVSSITGLLRQIKGSITSQDITGRTPLNALLAEEHSDLDITARVESLLSNLSFKRDTFRRTPLHNLMLNRAISEDKKSEILSIIARNVPRQKFIKNFRKVDCKGYCIAGLAAEFSIQFLKDTIELIENAGGKAFGNESGGVVGEIWCQRKPKFMKRNQPIINVPAITPLEVAIKQRDKAKIMYLIKKRFDPNTHTSELEPHTALMLRLIPACLLQTLKVAQINPSYLKIFPNEHYSACTHSLPLSPSLHTLLQAESRKLQRYPVSYMSVPTFYLMDPSQSLNAGEPPPPLSYTYTTIADHIYLIEKPLTASMFISHILSLFQGSAADTRQKMGRSASGSISSVKGGGSNWMEAYAQWASCPVRVLLERGDYPELLECLV